MHQILDLLPMTAAIVLGESKRGAGDGFLNGQCLGQPRNQAGLASSEGALQQEQATVLASRRQQQRHQATSVGAGCLWCGELHVEH